MERDPSDFWSMTDNVEGKWHLQSYFLVFRARALRSSEFRRFWESVELLPQKQTVIDTYELGMTLDFRSAGFSARALVPIEALPARPLIRRILRPAWRNPTLLQPLALLERKMPYVKVELLRDNPMSTRLGPIYEAMAQSGYDPGLIEIDSRQARP